MIGYFIRNKYTRQRTYCEDELPSCIDFGKSKYGGTFTFEQVEDVKTFFRLIPIAIVGGVLAGSVFTTDTIRDKQNNQLFKDISISESLKFQVAKCYQWTVIEYSLITTFCNST